MMPQLSDDARLVIAQWRGRPGATLHVIHDVCVPAGRISGHTMIPAVEEVRAAGLTDLVWDGHVLTDAGRELLASLPDEDGLSAARYPVEDGPGAGERVELTVRVLVGLERSTVIVADPLTGRALERDVVQHGGEAGAAAAAVYAALKKRDVRL
jgi:hypothetical protein